MLSFRGVTLSEHRFLDVEMPERFVLEFRNQHGEWMDWALLQAADFGRNDDGAYVCSGHGGSPVFIRCVRKEGEALHVVDGAGQPHVYRLVRFPSERYPSRAP